MSATLDGARFGALLGNAPLVKSEGQSWPLDVRYIGRRAEDRLEASLLAAVRQALADEGEGDMLAFLPGAADIERAGAAVEEARLRSEEHTSELQSLMRISYAVFCLKKKKKNKANTTKKLYNAS